LKGERRVSPAIGSTLFCAAGGETQSYDADTVAQRARFVLRLR
jgi:hypothetical protein